MDSSRKLMLCWLASLGLVSLLIFGLGSGATSAMTTGIITLATDGWSWTHSLKFIGVVQGIVTVIMVIFPKDRTERSREK